MKLSLVIPCYNEEEVLDMLYREIIETMKLYSGDFELIFIDDGSKDRTREIITGISQNDENVKFISFSRNFGKEAAMLAGLRFSSGDYVGILDADLQHPPRLVLEMIKALEEGFDVAAARRVDRIGETKFKNFFSSKFYIIMNKLADVEIKEGAQDFRVMRRKVVESIISMTEYHRFSKGIFSWVGFKTKWFEHENVERPAGRTKWNLIDLFRYAIDGIIAFSIVPLRISLFLGIIVSLLGFIYTFEIIISVFSNPEGVRSGFASIMCAIFLVGGTVLICLGILGEYIARIYIEAKRRPVFIIDETNIINENRCHE